MTSGSLGQWRRLAAAAWSAPSDPQFYGDLEVDAAALLAFQSRVRAATGTHVTLTHLVGRAIAHGLSEVPELRRPSRHGEESTSDVFFIVAEAGELTGVKLTDLVDKSAVQVATELADAVQRVHRGGGDLARATRALSRLPRPMLRAILRSGSWLTSEVGVGLPMLGLERRPFGDAMVTSVGMWGVAHAYSPLAAYYRVPVLVLVGEVADKPVAVAGRVVVRPMLGLTATFDHRYADGWHAARFARAAHDYLADPGRFEPEEATP